MAGYIGSKAVSVNTTSATISDDLSVGDDLTVTDDATIGGTLGVTGVVTANAGVVVDNITIDGQEIDVSSGDLTLDVEGDILLNANGGDIFLADDSVTFGKLRNSSSHFFIQSLVADKDILIIGNDGGSEVTAVEFDMSAAGAATFSGSLTIPSDIIHAGDADTLLQFNAADSFRIITGDEERLKASNGEVVINDNSVDMDFRVESNANINMLFVDGGGEVVTIGGLAGATSEDAGYFPLQVGNTGSGSTILQMLSATDAACTIHMGDAVSGAGRYDGYIQYGHGDRSMLFGTAGATKMTVETSGDVTIEDGNLNIGTSGHGIDFSAQTATSATNASTTSELLDHYEEGSWTPTLPSGGTVNSVQTCRYIRIGSLVTVYGHFHMTPTNDNTHFYIGGLPFGASPSNNHGGGNIGYSGGKDVSNFLGGLVDSSARVYYHVNTASTASIKNSWAGGTQTQFIFQIAYILA